MYRKKLFCNNIYNHLKNFTLLLFLFSISYCGTGTNSDDYRHLNSKISVVFSSPGISPDTAIDAKIQQKIAAMIDSARDTVEVCVYELSVPEIYNAMIRAHNRGVAVRFVGDIDCINTYEGYQAILAEGIPMTLGNPEKIMHNKFIIVDDFYLTMGSANYTPTGFWKNNENVIFIQDRDVALYFKKEFNLMYHIGTFGLEKKPQDFTNSVILGLGNYPQYDNYPYDNLYDNVFHLSTGTKLEIIFTPYLNGLSHASRPDITDEDGDGDISANDRIIAALKSAKHKIQFAMFAFTSDRIRNEMLKYVKNNPNVRIEGIFDKSWHSGITNNYVYGNEYAVHHTFIDEGHDVRYDGNNNVDPDNPLHGGKCHNKFAIVDPGTDNAKVITGSFNFSSAAATKGNDENCIIISDEGIAQLYTENFNKMYEDSRHPTRDVGGVQANVREIIFNEINWAGSRKNDGTRYYSDKFIELKNTTNKIMNISGWQIVGVCEYTWRITSYIFPKGTIIKPGGYVVLYHSLQNSAYAYVDNAYEYQFLYLYYGGSRRSQKFLSLTLKDSHQKVIDEAGMKGFLWPVKRYSDGYDSVNQANSSSHISGWGGYQGAQYKSMYRSNPSADGTLKSSWSSTAAPNEYISAGWRNNTFATPGTD